MSSELKVYNQFGEVILHIRFAAGEPRGFLTIDATEEMRNAVNSLAGQDFDRLVVMDNKPVRLAAKWGNPEYAQVLARYFFSNFGWNTKIVETDRIWLDSNVKTSGLVFACVGEIRTISFADAAHALVGNQTTNEAVQVVSGRQIVSTSTADTYLSVECPT